MDAAIVGLIRGHQDVKEYSKVLRRNWLVHQNVNQGGDYDILLFHEGDIGGAHRELLEAQIPNVELIDVSHRGFEIPDNIEAWEVPANEEEIGYRHMCQFRTLQQWDFVDNYDYVMQLDDDGWIESQPKRDIFEYCAEKNYAFGYVDRRGETHSETKETLPTFTKKYVRENDVQIKCALDDLHLEDCIINHFYLTETSFWQRQEVQDYFAAIKESGGIYKYRWGDSPILTLALKMFLESERLHRFDFNYTHVNHDWSNYQKSPLLKRIRYSSLPADPILPPYGYTYTEWIYWRHLYHYRRRFGGSDEVP